MKTLSHLPRSIRFIELWTWNQWTIKIYGISQHDTRPSEFLVLKAKDIAAMVFPKDAITDSRYGVGFMIIHEADMFNQIVFDWWERKNELRHIVYKSKNTDAHDFENITASGEAFCVWELKVIGFERDMWMQYILNPDGNLKAYLAQSLNIDE